MGKVFVHVRTAGQAENGHAGSGCMHCSGQHWIPAMSPRAKSLPYVPEAKTLSSPVIGSLQLMLLRKRVRFVLNVSYYSIAHK